MEDDVHRRIAGGGGLFHNDLGIAAVQGLLQTCEESADAFAFGGDESVGLVTGHDIVIYRKSHEE